LLRSAIAEAPSTIWKASQDLWDAANSAALAVAKITTLPASIARTIETMQRITSSHKTHWKLTMQATGIGWLRLEASQESLQTVLSDLRFELERDGGSLVVSYRPSEMQRIDVWGTPGDALPLMRAVKNQFDPRNTLNPGRFLAGV